MQTLPTLFKKTSTGATQIWYRELDEGKYRSVSGQINGQKVTSEWTVCSGKNIGRSNETSPQEQALSECESAYTKKLAQGGYHESIEDINTSKFFKPMLADKYDESKISAPVYSQPKLDGVRCIATSDGLFSRAGKPIDSCPHIMAELEQFFAKNPDAILDGELYADKLADNFNEIISLVRKQKPSASHFAKTEESIAYHVYDYPSAYRSFSVRSRLLADEFNYSSAYRSIKWVDTYKVNDLMSLDTLYSEYVEAGYEGQIVRLDGPYEQKRSKNLLKRKEFDDAEFTIVSVNEGKGNRSGMAGDITYSLPDGRTFGSGIRGGFAYYRALYDDREKYVGGVGTVRFFGYTPDGIPRFPVTVAVYSEQRDT